MPSFKKNIPAGLLPAALIVLFFCDHPFELPGLFYSPPAVFVGIVNGEYDSLPGNRTWPNSCILSHDTLRMRFFSETFTETTVRTGDFLRIDIMPDSTTQLGFGTKNVVFHMARYRDANYSYQIIPRDTLWAGGSAISMRISTFLPVHGGSIGLHEITATAKAMTGTEPLMIKKGRIFGTIQ